MTSPFWFRLVHTWCLNGHRGLTLPFIVGADARAQNISAEPARAREILLEIQAFEDSTVSLILLWCPNRGAPVIGIEWSAGKRLRIDESLKEKWKKDEGAILEELVHLSEMRIKEGNFSRVGDPPYAEWQPFTPGDLDFIDSVIPKAP